MFQSLDSLGQEIINVQLLDLYFKDGEIRTESVFFNEDYIHQMEKMQNLLKYYEKSGQLDEDECDIEEDVEYTLDDVLKLLVDDLDSYALIYNIPKLTIENVEWELFFTTIANYYKKQEFSYFFINDMVYLNKMVMARSMVYEIDSIDLKTYIKSLKYLESDILSISNILEIAEKLGKVFKIDALSLLANEDGSYGCIGKDSELFILDEEDEKNLEALVDKTKEYLQEKGYKVNETVEIRDSEKKGTNTSFGHEIVDFSKYKRKKRK